MKSTKKKSFSGMKVTPERANAAYASDQKSGAAAARLRMIEKQRSRDRSDCSEHNE